MSRVRVNLIVDELRVQGDVRVNELSLTVALETELCTLIQQRGLPTAFAGNRWFTSIEGESPENRNCDVFDESSIASSIIGSFWK